MLADGVDLTPALTRLYGAVPSRKELVIVEGADHNDLALLNGDRMMAAVFRFLARMRLGPQ